MENVYSVKCDDCKKTMKETTDVVESYAGGICETCRESNRVLEEKKIRRNRSAKRSRDARKRILEMTGLVKVKGALGGTYWE